MKENANKKLNKWLNTEFKLDSLEQSRLSGVDIVLYDNISKNSVNKKLTEDELDMIQNALNIDIKAKTYKDLND